jgi:glycosyltransferase involved in cell wall biosynthesis
MDREVKRNWRTRLIYRRLVDRAVAISPAVSRRLLDAGVPAERVITIPSVVDPRSVRTEADRERTRAALGVAPEAFVLLSLVSLVKRKGIDVLLRALSAMRAAEAERTVLLVGGEGPEHEPLEVLAEELGLSARVTFLGRRTDKAELLAACDAFVLPSRQEGLGVAALEAMAAGRAVVASRVGGLGETVLDEGTGLLVPPGEPEALARALDRLLEEPELRERLGAAGPARVEDGHLPEQMVAAYEKLYREILESR